MNWNNLTVQCDFLFCRWFFSFKRYSFVPIVINLRKDFRTQELRLLVIFDSREIKDFPPKQTQDILKDNRYSRSHGK